VYLIPLTVEVDPALEHTAPAFAGAAYATRGEETRTMAVRAVRSLRIFKMYRKTLKKA
jgi:hypothetical protein